MLLLVDYRSDDVSRGHGLRRLRSELRRRRTLQEIAVEGLAAAAVSGLLERTLGAAVAPSLCDAVFDRTDGVPFLSPNWVWRSRSGNGSAPAVCPICVNAKGLQEAPLIDSAIVGGTVPMWEWIGGDGATTFSY